MDRTTTSNVRPKHLYWMWINIGYTLGEDTYSFNINLNIFHFIAQKVFCYGIVTFALLHLAIKSRYVYEKSGEPSVKKYHFIDSLH
jgi:hypothetical protein